MRHMADAAARKDLAWNNQWATVGQQALSPSPPQPRSDGCPGSPGRSTAREQDPQGPLKPNATLSLTGLGRVGGRPTAPPFCIPGPDSCLVLSLPRGDHGASLQAHSPQPAPGSQAEG